MATSANLPAIPLKLSYRTGRDDLAADFFVPCLQASTHYRRAAGYFSSAGLALAARGIASLAARRGRMQLVVSPHLEPADVEALQAAHENPAAALKAIATRSLADIEDALIKDRLNALAWLSATGLLEIGSSPHGALWDAGNSLPRKTRTSQTRSGQLSIYLMCFSEKSL